MQAHGEYRQGFGRSEVGCGGPTIPMGSMELDMGENITSGGTRKDQAFVLDLRADLSSACHGREYKNIHQRSRKITPAHEIKFE